LLNIINHLRVVKNTKFIKDLPIILKMTINLESIENVIMQGMRLTREKTISNFGIAKSLNDKEGASIASQALTEVDLHNQETILVHLFNHFPDLAISVEERTEDPTEVQAKFYDNEGKSDLCFTLDAIDGTYAYKNGIRNDYGIIGSIMKRKHDNVGEFISGLLYFPTHDLFLLANDSGFFEIQEDHRKKLDKSSALVSDREEYSAIFIHDKKRLELDFDRFVNEIYSTTQMVLQMIRGEIPGFLTSYGHVYDQAVGPWMLSKWGADVIYASGIEYGELPFGDKIIDGERIPPRDRKGLLIVGDKSHPLFKEYVKHHVVD